VTNYSAVFTLIAMQPFVNIFFSCFARYCIKAPSTSSSTAAIEAEASAAEVEHKDTFPLSSSSSTSTWFSFCWWTGDKRKAFFVPPLLRTKEEQLLLQSNALGIDLHANVDQDVVVEATLCEEVECCIVMPVVNVFMLLTFGIVNSLLGFVLLVSLYVSSLWQQVLMGRFVTLALQEDGDKRLVEQLERACARASLAPLRDTAPYGMLVSTFFLACFLLDIAADEIGFPNAFVAPTLLVCIIFLAWLKIKFQKDDGSEAMSRQETEVEMTTTSPSPLARGIVAVPV